MSNGKKIYFNAETFQVEELGAENPKIILSGLAMPFERMSRNGVNYRTESIKKAYASLKGVSFLFNHDTNKPLGHVEDVSLSSEGMLYKADLDPQEQYYANKIKRQDIRHVSIGALVSNPEYNDKDGSVTVDVDEFVELSLVPVPGFKDATASMQSLEATPLMIAEAFDNKDMVEKLKSQVKEAEGDKEDEDEDEDEKKKKDAEKESDDEDKDDKDKKDAEDKEKCKGKKEELETPVVKMDEILFIRVLELFNENKFEDVKLHEFAKRVEEALANKEFLTIEDYDNILGDLMEKSEGIDSTPTDNNDKDQSSTQTPTEKDNKIVEAKLDEIKSMVEDVSNRVGIIEARLDAKEEEDELEDKEDEADKEDSKDKDAHAEPDEDNKGGPSDNDADNKDPKEDTENEDAEKDKSEDKDEEDEEKKKKSEHFERVGTFAPIKLDSKEEAPTTKINANDVRLNLMSY